MPNWKKLIVSGSDAALNSLNIATSITGSTLQLTNPPSQASEATSLMIGASGNVGTRELGSNAFNSTAFTTCTGTVTSVGGTGNVSGITLSGTVTSTGNLTLGGTFSTTTSSITNFNSGVGTIVDGCNFTTCTGTVTTTGTPLNNQIAIFTNSNTVEGDANFTWDGSKIFLANGKHIQFTDQQGSYPTNKDSKFKWLLNNDSYEHYAFQPSSDQIDVVYKITDNVGSTDRFVWWIDDYRGETYDAYPLYADGNSVIVNYKQKYNTGTAYSNNVDFYVAASGSTSHTTNPVLKADVSNSRVGIGTNSPSTTLDVNGNVALNGIVLDSNTITGIDDSGEFTNDDAHIMTSAGVNDRITSRISGLTSCVGTVTSVTAGAGMTQTGTSTINPTLNVIGGTAITVNANNIEVTAACNTAWNAKTTCTGTVTGTGVNNRVATWSGTTSLDSNSAFTYDGTTLNVGSKATIGTNHSNTGTFSTIAGGTLNTASVPCSFIGGGYNNSITGCDLGSIVGGQNNTISGGYNGFIGAGCDNTLSAGYGCDNSIVGGTNNDITGGCGVETNIVVGGRNNTISGDYTQNSGILGGLNNCINGHDTSFIIGSNITSTATCYTFMNNACVAGTTRTQTLVETSARRYKECILPLQDQIKNIKKLEPVEFQWKKDKTKDIGFIAEEVEKIYPNLIAYEEDGEISGIQYSKLTTVLVKALQQQQEQISELKKEITKIKNNLNG